MLMRLLALVCFVVLALSACSPPSNTTKQEAQKAEKWPPADYDRFAARPPMSVGAELQDPWTLAIDAERWSYRMGLAIEGLGGVPPAELEGAKPDDLLARAHLGQRNAAIRLLILQKTACGPSMVARAGDCSAFSAPQWVAEAASNAARPSNDELMQRNIWFNQYAEPFILPACAAGAKRMNDPNFCNVE